MTPKERAAMQQALEAIGNTVNQALATIREALAEPQITTPDVCGEVCARAKLCYGCNKDLEEANAKYAEQAEQEPVAWTNYNGAVNNRLKGAPVDAKAIRAEALEEAAKFAYDLRFRCCWTAEAIAAAIRGMK